MFPLLYGFILCVVSLFASLSIRLSAISAAHSSSFYGLHQLPSVPPNLSLALVSFLPLGLYSNALSSL